MPSRIDSAGAGKFKAHIGAGLDLKMGSTLPFVVDSGLYPGQVSEEVLGRLADWFVGVFHAYS